MLVVFWAFYSLVGMQDLSISQTFLRRAGAEMLLLVVFPDFVADKSAHFLVGKAASAGRGGNRLHRGDGSVAKNAGGDRRADFRRAVVVHTLDIGPVAERIVLSDRAEACLDDRGAIALDCLPR